MPRPPLVLETWGKIRRTVVAGKPAAVAYYRDSDGETRKMQRQGRSAADAERKLIEAMRNRLSPASEDLTRDSRVSLLAEKWLQETDARDLKPGTVRLYRETVERHVSPGLGEIRIAEATVPRIDRFVKSLTRSSGPGTAKTARVVLAGMFALAARHGAVDSNPVRDIAKVPTARRVVSAPDLATVKAVRQRFAEWDAALDKRGHPRTTDLLDPCDVFIGTGVRTGELLALTWRDVDLDAGTITVRTTIAADRTGRFAVQDDPKTMTSRRVLHLPPHAVALLRRRHQDAMSEFVFPSTVGTFRHPNNFRSRWREALAGTEYAGITPKSFRKAVATAVRDRMGVGAAKDQLGHASESTTNQHYVRQAHEGPAVQDVLELLYENGE